MIVVQRALEPTGIGDRSWTRESWTSLQENEPGPRVGRFFAVPHPPRENGQRFTVGPLVIERNGEFVVGQLHAVMAHGRKRSECCHVVIPFPLDRRLVESLAQR